MEEFIDGITGILAIFCAVGLPIGFGMYLGLTAIRSRHKENIELIKQGIVPVSEKGKSVPNKFRALRNGMLFIGIALGLIIGLIITETLYLPDGKEYIALGGSVLLFLGIAYVLYYVLIRNKQTENEAE